MTARKLTDTQAVEQVKEYLLYKVRHEIGNASPEVTYHAKGMSGPEFYLSVPHNPGESLEPFNNFYQKIDSILPFRVSMDTPDISDERIEYKVVGRPAAIVGHARRADRESYFEAEIIR